MKLIRCTLLLLLALAAAPAPADEVHVGIEISAYPQLVLVPGFPVYYAPEVRANYFFYDGDFWLFDEHWYRSPWYDGPWERVERDDVPDVILQIPIRYYVAPPAFFFGWSIVAAPHWGEHWGHDWERRRHGWDRHEHRERYGVPAPLPDYQRHFNGGQYPRERERQHELQHRNYGYRPHDPFVQRSPRMPGAGVPHESRRGPGREREGR